MQNDLPDKINILVTSEGGQGGQILSTILAQAADQADYQVTLLPHYGVEKRGGISLAYLIISRKPIANPRFSQADIIVFTTWRQKEIPQRYLDSKTLFINGLGLSKILIDKHLPLKSLNILILGILTQELARIGYQLSPAKIKKIIQEKLAKKRGLEENLQAFDLGLTLDYKFYRKNLSQIKKPNLKPLVKRDKEKTFIRFPSLCKGCGLCLEKCPKKALSWPVLDRPSRERLEELNFLQRPMPKIDLGKCIACGICQEICPDCAIKISRR